MSECIVPPSPNWFLSDCLSVGEDGYVVYGTLSTDIALLIPSESSPLFFSDVKIIQHAHKDRVTCISLCPNWLTSRLFVSGADDGFVKLWNSQTCSYKIAHNTHFLKKESVIAAAFLDSNSILSVGSSSLLALWNIKSNFVQSDSKVIKFFKPISLAVCPHKPNTVAIGTKQGVVVVLSVSDKISILYKAPGHKAEVTSLSWCPTPSCEYLDKLYNASKLPDNTLSFKKSKSLNSTIEVKSIQDRLKREENENLSKIGHLDNKPLEDEDDFLKECRETLNLIKAEKNDDSDLIEQNRSIFDNFAPIKPQTELNSAFDEFGRSKYIPKIIQDDLETTVGTLNNETLNDGDCTSEIADESDIFDIYADQDTDEFGHGKIFSASGYEKLIPSPIKKTAEVMQKIDIDALSSNIDTMKLEENNEVIENTIEVNDEDIESTVNKLETKTDYFYLASCCKKGFLCIWRWGGVLVLSRPLNNTAKNKIIRKITHPFGAINWIKSSEIIVASKESQLISIKFLLDKMKMSFSNLHNEHKRGLFRIASNTSNLTNYENSNPVIWSASMDRLLIGHSIGDNFTNVYSTLGGFVYDLQISPIDPMMFAIGGGDGTIRIYRLVQEKSNEHIKMKFIKQFWNGVSGKVLSVAWHPNKEKCLAFTTYEGRIGLLDVSTESPAKIFPTALSLGASHICWDQSNNLLACGGDTLVVYNVSQLNKDPEKIVVNVCNETWNISTMSWNEKFLCVGSSQGGFALLKPIHPFELVTATFPHKKRIQSIAWHPNAVISEDVESPYANFIAVSANAKNLVILQIVECEDNIKLETHMDLITHADNIISINWSPHHNGHILSTSKDCTVQIWDVINKCLLHSFAGHQEPALTAVWCPSSSKYVISSGGDHSLRIWDINKYPPQTSSYIKGKQRKKMSLAKLSEFDNNLATLQMESEEHDNSTIVSKSSNDIILEEDSVNLAVIGKSSIKKSYKKHHLLVNFWKDYKKSSVEGCRRLFEWVKMKRDGNMDHKPDYSDGFDYLKIYGKRDDIIQLLNIEKDSHVETHNWNAYFVVGTLSGSLKETMEFMSEKGKLTSSLLCLAPSVSHRFWKEISTSYCSQLDGEDLSKTHEHSIDGMGKIWQALLLLSIGQIEESCMSFSNAGFEAEAICAARVRHIDHIGDKHLNNWAKVHVSSANYCKAAECFLSMGSVMEAAMILGKSNNETELALAAELAKYSGNIVYAESISNGN